MSCSPFDLREYFLKELPDSGQREVDAHLRNCQSCREELERLRLTEAALFSLRDEEIPQRIAFVSDKIFEPSPWRRWWGAFWGSSARLAFASAGMLSVAILVFALRPAGQIAVVPGAPRTVQTAAVSDSEIQARIDAAVAKAVGLAEVRQMEKTKAMVADLENTRQRLLLAADEFDYYQRRVNAIRISAGNYGPPRADNGELK
jgi:anti-sigma factor RsiW